VRARAARWRAARRRPTTHAHDDDGDGDGGEGGAPLADLGRNLGGGQ
jgi:hypothetical protein